MSKKPIRTCVSCRSRRFQNTLIRLQCVDKKLIAFSGIGRSFYICKDCVENKNKLEKALFRSCKNKDDYISQLEEILRNG